MMDTAEVDDFLENVSQVSRLIDGLKAGTISPEYVDTKLQERDTKRSAGSQRGSTGAQAAAGRAPGGAPATGQADAGGDVDGAAAEARQAKLMRKVEELKRSRERKQQARQRYQDHIAARAAMAQQQQADAATDYGKWDLWCPSDEDDELFNSLCPDTLQFRALERDIDERHARMVEQRQIAERQRVRGNEAFKSGQFGEALRCYELGLDAQRHNMTLHANAAMAALKLQCYVQAMEHASKVLHLADLLHDAPKDPLCVKAYLRRAAAYEALDQLDKAVADLQAATAIEPQDPEVAKQLARAQRLLQEKQQAKQLSRLLAQQPSKGPALKARGGDAAGGQGPDASKLLQVEQLVARLKGVSSQGPLTQQLAGAAAAGEALPVEACSQCTGQGSDEPAAACAALQALLEEREEHRCYFRQCGGMAAAAMQLKACTSQPHPANGDTGCAPLLLMLNAACHNETCLEQLQQGGLLVAAINLLSSAQAPTAAAAALLLATASTNEGVRQQLSTQLCAADARGLSSLLELVGQGHPGAQAMALSVLRNCMLTKPVKAAARSLLQAQPQLLQRWEALLAPSAAARECMAVLDVLTNMCGDAPLRQQLAEGHPALVMRVAALAVAAAEGGVPPAHGGGAAIQLAALGCLANLSLEPAAHAALSDSALAGPLLAAACVPPASAAGSAPLMAERAAVVVSRMAKHTQGRQVLLQARAVELLVAGLAAATAAAAAPPSGGCPATTNSSLGAWCEACVRTVALLTADGAYFGGCSQQVARAAAAALTALLDEPQYPQPQQQPCAAAPAAFAGNASLCFAHLASNPAWLGLMHELDCAAPLVRVAREGRGDAASKNAAVALARMSRHPPIMERLKELRGVEIICQYGRPAG